MIARRLRSAIRNVPAWLLPLAAVAILAACERNDPGVEVVRFWAMGREGEIVEQLLPEFHRRWPDIHIDVQKLPWTGAHQKILTAFAADATPDLCQLGNTWIPELAALGALAPLGGRADSSGAVEREDYFPGIWNTNIVDDELYGVPWYVDTRLLFYRKDILARAGFDAPPRDWDEWRHAMAAIKAVVGDDYAILLPLNEFEPLLALTLQQNASPLREDGTRGNFDTPDFRRTLAFYLDIFRQGWAPAVSNTQISNVWNEFGRGFYSFYISGPWNIAEFKKRLPADLQDDWMTAPLPGPDGLGASIAGGSSLVIFRQSERSDAAWAFIEYLSEPETQLRFNELTGNLPPRRSVWDDPRLSGDVHAAAFRDQLERVKPTPKVPEWERIVDEMRLVAEQAVYGRMDVDEAVSALNRRTNVILEKRRWILDRRAASHASATAPSDTAGPSR